MQESPTHLEYLAEGAISFVLRLYMRPFPTVCMNARMKNLAENQQQLLALSAAAARAACKHDSKGGLRESVQLPATTAYKEAGLFWQASQVPQLIHWLTIYR